eukprot:scaffold16426_cov22-Tisochrysis_lutea.AAC.2
MLARNAALLQQCLGAVSPPTSSSFSSSSSSSAAAAAVAQLGASGLSPRCAALNSLAQAVYLYLYN